jgi:hypothetical protein
MATEREVNLRLGASLKPGAGESLKALSRIMDELGDKTKPTFAALNEAQEKSAKLARQVEQALRGVGKAGAQDLGRLVEDAKKANAELERLQKALAKAGAPQKSILGKTAGVFGEAGKGIAQGAVGSTPLGGLIGAAGVAGAALAAFAITVKALDTGVKSYYGSLQGGPGQGGQGGNPEFNTEAYRRKQAQEMRGTIPILGEAMYHYKTQDLSREHYERIKGSLNTRIDQTSFGRSVSGFFGRKIHDTSSYEAWKKSNSVSNRDQDYQLFLAKQGIGIAAGQAGAQSEALSRSDDLRMEQARLAAQGKSSINLRKAGYGIMSMTAHAQTAAIANTRAVSGYGREQQLEDAMRQIGMKESLLKIGAEGRSKQEVIDAQLGMAQKQEQSRQGKYSGAKKEEQAALGAVESALKQKKTYEEVNRLADLATAATEKRKAAESSLMQAQEKSLALQKAGHENALQIQERQSEVMKSQLQTIQQQRQAEQKRKQGMREDLGLMNPNKLRTMLHVARKVKAGQAVTQNELEFMKGNSNVFGSQLQQIGAGMATKGPNAAMIRELMDITGQDKREKALDKQSLQLQNQMNFQVNIDANSVSDSLLKKVTPQINNALAQLEQRLQAELSRIMHQANQQKRTLFPGQQ